MAETPAAVRREPEWADLVRRCALREESALATLYDESSSLVYKIAIRILRDEADASEVVVDVYRQVWDGAARFDEQRGTATAWIVILARSRAMDKRRRKARTRSESLFDELPNVISSEPSPESLAIASQNSCFVMQALEAIRSEQRLALELAFFAGLSHSEIAERLGEPLGTVKTRIRLAVAKLRELLSGTV